MHVNTWLLNKSSLDIPGPHPSTSINNFPSNQALSIAAQPARQDDGIAIDRRP